MKTTFSAALVLFAASAIPALAQQPAQNAAPMPAQMPAMTMPKPDAGASPSSKAFKAADDKMMHAMNAPMSGNADQDFVAGMLPHHQGAVDMAKVELHYGKDPAMRRLAAGIIKAQEREIAEMHAWQAKHPVAP